MSSLKQNIREKLDYYKLWETKGLLNDYDTGQKHALMDMLKLLDEATKQIQEKALCPLIDYRNVKIAYSPKTNEPYLATGFNPCQTRTCATCTIRNQHLVVKLEEVLAVLEGERE